MEIKRIILAAGIAAIALAASAVPAKRGYYTVYQPDGTTLRVCQTGDENWHVLLTDDNKLVVEQSDGTFCYGHLNRATGVIESNGIRAVDAAIRPDSHRYLTQDISEINCAEAMQSRIANGIVPRIASVRATAEHMVTDRNRAAAQRAVAQQGMGRFEYDFPNKGKVPAIVILAEFSDLSFKEDSYYNGRSAKEYFTDMICKDGFSDFRGTGSAHQFFYENSMGRFDPDFEVYGPVTLSRTMSYYGGNDSNGQDLRPEMMVAEACRLLDDEVDFSKFDTNGDGLVDNVFVFYAGRGEASGGGANTVWPHSYDVRYAGISCNLDGVTIGRYACTNEWESSKPDGIGTFVHEFSHVMGLPDLYSTDYGSADSLTPGSYSTLDYGPYNNGGRTPPAYSAYERNAMEWIEPRLLDSPESVTLDHVMTSNDACIVQTDSETEFFLFENRQQVGWDAYIPGHGMLIWHVDYNRSIYNSNIVNNSASHQYVDIIEAGGTANNTSSVTMAAYPWPGTKNKTEFTSSTKPAFKSWSGKALPDVTAITEDEGIITFDFDGGGTKIAAPVPLADVNKGDNWFEAAWSPVEGATDYIFSAYGVTYGGVPVDHVADMGSAAAVTLPDGWSASTGVGAYSTPGNYGNAAPSMKMSASGQSVTSARFDKDVKRVQFWYKGMQASGSTLAVSGYDAVNNAWVLLENIIPDGQNQDDADIDVTVPDIRQIKLEYTKSKGNVGIDDIVITCGGARVDPLEGHLQVKTDGATTRRVEGLDNSRYEYYQYEVRATDGKNLSRVSDRKDVSLTAGIADPSVSATDVRIAGRTVTVTTSAPRADVYSATGALLATWRVSDGSITFDLPAAGLYIVRTGTTATKLIAR